MPIPDYETLMLPVLKLLDDQKEHPINDLEQAISEDFGLTDDEKQQRLQSGHKRVIYGCSRRRQAPG